MSTLRDHVQDEVVSGSATILKVIKLQRKCGRLIDKANDELNLHGGPRFIYREFRRWIIIKGQWLVALGNDLKLRICPLEVFPILCCGII